MSNSQVPTVYLVVSHSGGVVGLTFVAEFMTR